jgi:NAD(P)-dependent dehydrogenase (short-subunit alcohol dehydrogenase family)
MDELRFDGKVALITGAARGVGKVHALTMAARGAKVVIMDPGGELDGTGASSGPAADAVREIVDAGGEAVAAFESVTDEQGAARAVQLAIDTFGGLDIVINNAGIADPELFEHQTAEQFRRMCDVQYLGTVYTTKAAWPHLMETGGRIVNTCSEGPLGIHGKLTSYGGAKGAVVGFTLCLAAEGRAHGIAVNGFSPRASTRLSSPEVMSKTYDVPAEHFVESMKAYPPELASPAAVYLAHDSCPLNGVILVAGGGQVLRMAFAESVGVKVDDLSVEDVAARIDEIVDLTGATFPGLGHAEKTVQADAASESS